MATVIALAAATLVSVGSAPAQAVQATGDDVPAWSNGWNWTWGTSFKYQAADGTVATINEDVKYTVVNRETFQGQDAYKLEITGNITGGSGTVPVEGLGNASLHSFSGNVTGTRFVRVSDLALLQENQQQNLTAKATVRVVFDVTTNVRANINLSLTPSNSTWKVHNFPLNAGDSWNTSTDVTYTGGFSYEADPVAGQSIPPGNEPFDGTLEFDAPSTVASETVSVPIGANINTKKVTTVNADASMSDVSWWSPVHKNQVKEILVLPLDGGSVTLTRDMKAASLPSGTAQFSATTTPSLTCAGGTVNVSGALSTAQAGVPVTVRLDQSQLTPGTGITATGTTGTNGAYSINIPTPTVAQGVSDNLGKNGPQGPSRANWGIAISGGGANGASTVVITPTNCSTLQYTGATGGPVSGSATVSAKLTDLADPAGAAGRTVSFALSGGGSVNATTNASGVATATLPLNGPVRNATITASYAGSTALAAASTSTGFAVQVNPTSTTVLPSAQNVILGDNVTFSATVTPAVGANPGGNVQFYVDGAAFGGPRPVSGGQATSAALNSSLAGLGFHDVRAEYLGDANFGPSTSPTVQFRVRVPLLNTTTTQSITPSSTVYGQNVELTATVGTTSGSGNPTGDVTFSEGGTVYGTAPVIGGVATVNTATIPVGAHSITASYSGDDEYNGSASSPDALNVAKADVAVDLTSSDTTTVSGEAVNFGVSVAAQAPGSGLPDGTVQLVIDGNNAGSPVALTGGVANFDPVTSLLVGNHTVAVTYSGSSNFKTGSDSLTQEVSQAETTTTVLVSPSPSSEDQNVNITANVAAVAPGGGAATGLVSFTANGDPIGSASLSPSSGGASATLQTAALAPGTYAIVASYAGDADYAGSVSPEKNHTVLEGAAIVVTKTTVTSSQNPSTYGEFVSFTATVTDDDEINNGPEGEGDIPEGAVQFSVDGVDVGIPVEVAPDGTATSPLIASPEAGDHTVIAAFVGNPGWGSSGDFLAQTVSAAPVGVTVTSSNASSAHGEAVTFTAKVVTPAENVGTPGGHVQFRVDGVAVGGAVALNGAGEATSAAVSNLTPGTHAVTADYSGSEHFAPGLASTTQNVGKVATSTALVATPSTVNFGGAVTLTATVTPASTALGAPTGTVTFTEGSTTLGTAVVGANGTNGKASITVSNFSGGTHTVKATYSGSSSFGGSASANATVNVNKLATTISARGALVNLVPLSLPLGNLQATVNSANGPVAGVPVAFTIGNTTVCTSTTNAYGVANCNALSQLLPLTLLGFKASFAGNGDYTGSTAQGVILK